MGSVRHDLARKVSVAVALVSAASGALADDPVLQAHVSSRAGYSDNIGLAPAGFEHSESLAELTAGLDFSRKGQREETRLSYQAQGVFYGKSHDSDEVYNTLNAQSRWALVLDRLFVDMFAVYDQTAVSATKKYSFNKLALTGNRTDVGILGVSPSISLAFGDNVTGEIRFVKTNVDYRDATLQDDEQQVTSLKIGNPDVRRGASWSVAYDSEDYDYERSPKVHFETFDGELGYWFGPTFRLFTTQGLESDYTLVGRATPGGKSPGLDQHFWYVGVEWRPNDRNDIVVSTGERSYGNAHRFQWHYRAARGGGVNVSYSEQPATFLRDQLNSVRSVGQLTPIDSLDGPGGSLFYLQKRGDVTFLRERPRSSAALRFFIDRRFDIVDLLQGLERETEFYKGTELSLRWVINYVTTLAVSSQIARRRSLVNVVDDDLNSLSIGYERRIGRQSAFTVDLSHEKAQPRSIVSVNQYTENQVVIGIRRTFGTGATAAAPQRFTGYLNGAQY